VRAVVFAFGTAACASSPPATAKSEMTSVVDAGAEGPAAASPDAMAPTPAPVVSEAPAPIDAGPPALVPVKVKIVTIGMHVAGGPFDEPTKEPFKRAVEPQFLQFAQCWGRHVPHSPAKQIDVGVDLLIEASGGTPKVSNPRSTLKGYGPEVAAETEGFVPCVVGVFESIVFPKLDRGRTGVSYSLRFTP
jgi:hypothetical protein